MLLPTLIVLIALYSTAGCAISVISAIAEHWPHKTNTLKTVVFFLACDPIFWICVAGAEFFMRLHKWLKEE